MKKVLTDVPPETSALTSISEFLQRQYATF